MPTLPRRANADVIAILREPAVVRRLAEFGMVADPMTQEGFAAFLRAEREQWAETARVANVRIEG